MASRNFETAAVIRLIDDLSGPMRALAREVGGLNKEFGRQMVRDHEQAAAQAGSHWTKFGQTIADAGKVAAAGLVAASKHALEAALHSARETDRTLARAHALDPNMTPKQYKEAQDFVNRNPELGRTTEEAAGALKAAEMQGVHEPKAQQALVRASRSYAIDNDIPMPQAVNEVAEHVNMRGELKNKNGQAISLGQASVAEIEKLVPQILGQLAILGKHSSSNSHQIFEVMKYVGPLAKEGALGIPFESLAGIIAQLGVVGIKGEEAGVAMKQLFARTLAPTNRGRFASNVMGVKFEDYATIDRERINPDNVISALGPKLGDLPANTKNQLRHVMANLKSGISSFQEFQTQFTEALVSSGVKSMKNRASAGNVTRDISALLVKDIDVTKLIELLHKRSSGPGFVAALNEIFGRQAGGRLSSVNPEEFRQAGGVLDQMRAEGDPAEFARKSRENFDSHLAPTMDRAQKALEGVGNEIIQQFEPALKTLLNTFLKGTQMFHGLTEDTKSAIAYGGLALGTAVSLALAAITGRIATNLYKGITASGGAGAPPVAGEVAAAESAAAQTIPKGAAGNAATPREMAGSFRAPPNQAEISARTAVQGEAAAKAAVESVRTEVTAFSRAVRFFGNTFRGAAGGIFLDLDMIEKVRTAETARSLGRKQTIQADAAKVAEELRERATPSERLHAEHADLRRREKSFENQTPVYQMDGIPADQMRPLRVDVDKEFVRKRMEELKNERLHPKPFEPDVSQQRRDRLLEHPTDANQLGPFNTKAMPQVPASVLDESPTIPFSAVPPVGMSFIDHVKKLFGVGGSEIPATAVLPTVLTPVQPPPPQEVRVQGSAELRTQVDVHLTGLDLVAGQLSRTVNGTTTINLGASATGLQGVPYQPLTPPAAAPTSQPAVRSD